MASDEGMLQQAYQAMMAQINGRRSLHYQRLFMDDDGTPSIDGQKVLADLRKFCRGDRSTFDADPRIHALLEGRREVFLRILAMLDMPSEATKDFLEVSDE